MQQSLINSYTDSTTLKKQFGNNTLLNIDLTEVNQKGLS